MKLLILLLFYFISFLIYSQDTTYLKVHFLYGSKPMKKYIDTESDWFGGILGGHVGLGTSDEKIVSFFPFGKFHWIAKNDDKHSTFTFHSEYNFYAVLGGNPDSVKKAIVYIPITSQQKEKFDSITTAYLKQTPYDYALIGMRCGAATYDILAQLDIFPKYSYSKTYKKIFYPRKLRKRLFKKALENGWKINRIEGSKRRRWERD